MHVSVAHREEFINTDSIQTWITLERMSTGICFLSHLLLLHVTVFVQVKIKLCFKSISWKVGRFFFFITTQSQIFPCSMFGNKSVFPEYLNLSPGQAHPLYQKESRVNTSMFQSQLDCEKSPLPPECWRLKLQGGRVRRWWQGTI